MNSKGQECSLVSDFNQQKKCFHNFDFLISGSDLVMSSKQKNVICVWVLLNYTNAWFEQFSRTTLHGPREK